MLSPKVFLLLAISLVGLVQALPLSLPLITNHAAQTSDFDVQAINTSVDDQLGIDLLETIVGPAKGQHKG